MYKAYLKLSLSLSTHGLGKQAETLAATYLQTLGWQIVEKNWRCEFGEIDLIAHDGQELVFVEVRSRRGRAALDNAVASIGVKKQARLRSLAEFYAAEYYHSDIALRVDVIGIAMLGDGTMQIEWIKDALSW